MKIKNNLFLILVLTMLALPCYVQAVPCHEPVDTVQEEVVQPEAAQEVIPIENLLDEDLDPNSFPHKQPVSKKKIAKKFLLAMAGVGISSILIFLMLTVYNKIREGFSNQFKNTDEEVSLQTPDDLQGAVKAFLSKTNWK